jgi:hypothetical protein
LQELGKLQDNPAQALTYLQQVQDLYEQIGDGYSQSRNLVRFMADALVQSNQPDQAIDCLTRAAELAEGTEYEFFREQALEKIQTIQG